MSNNPKFRHDQEIKLDFNDVLIEPKLSNVNSRRDVDLEVSMSFLHSPYVWKGIPIIASNMDSTGTFEMFFALKEFKMPVCLHKHYEEDQLIEFYSKWVGDDSDYAWYSMGINAHDKEKFDNVKSVVGKDVIRFVKIDAPSAYLDSYITFLKQFREENPNICIMAGNIATAEGAVKLILAGADIVAAGIGGGSGCSTRLKAGVGYPQLSAVLDIKNGIRNTALPISKLHICSDGGIVHPADLGKAFGAGASFVMAGGIFAGHRESGGAYKFFQNYLESPTNYPRYIVDGIYNIVSDEVLDTLDKLADKEKYLGKVFYGMSSTTAQETYYGEKLEYRSSEGREFIVPYKGKVKDTVLDMLGGLRSTCTYVGAKSVSELYDAVTFVRVNKIVNTDLYGLGKL